MTTRSSVSIRAVLVAAASAFAVAAIGGTVTTIGPWYRQLAKPAWTPPDLAFPIVWTTIFALAAVAGVTVWRAARTPVAREWIIGLFALNGFLNVLWSLLFFRLQRPDWALLESVALWLSVAALVGVLSRISKLASLLMTPYLVWVSIACFLNQQIVHLNPPFG